MTVRALLATLLLLVVSATASAQGESQGEASMLARINAMRRAADLPPLQRHEGLDEAARRHSADMAEHGELAHVSARTGDPAARVRQAGVDATALAQNIARNATILGAHRAIINSERHRGQLLQEQMTHIGIAIVHGADGYYVTQVIAHIDEPAAGEEDPGLPPPAVTPVPVPTPPVESPVEAPLIDEAPTAEPASPQAPVPPPAAPPPNAGPAAPTPAQPGAAPPAAQPRQATGSQNVVPGNARGVPGYWVFHNGRWWYFPVPPGARPGQRLTPDLSVQGPPPGYLPNGQRAPGSSPYPQSRPSAYGYPPAQPQPYPQAQPSPYGPSQPSPYQWGWSTSQPPPPPPPPPRRWYVR